MTRHSIRVFFLLFLCLIISLPFISFTFQRDTIQGLNIGYEITLFISFILCSLLFYFILTFVGTWIKIRKSDVELFISCKLKRAPGKRYLRPDLLDNKYFHRADDEYLVVKNKRNNIWGWLAVIYGFLGCMFYFVVDSDILPIVLIVIFVASLGSSAYTKMYVPKVREQEQTYTNLKKPLSVYIRNTLWIFTLSAFLVVFVFSHKESVYVKHSTSLESHEGILALGLFIMFVGFWNVGFCWKNPVRTFTFNRMDGTFTTSRFWPFKDSTYPFERLAFFVSKGNDFQTIMGANSRCRVYVPYHIMGVKLVGEGDFAWCCFYIWYMDKNRPLPEGNIFDSYREKDQQRRRAEGNLPPIYNATRNIENQMSVFFR